MQGASAFETDPNTKSVATYAQGSIYLNPIPDGVAANLTQGNGGPAQHYFGHHSSTKGTARGGPFGNYQGSDVVLAGVIYAGGNFTTNLTSTNTAVNAGALFMDGVLEAYGGNVSANQNPGSVGGVVNVDVANSQYVFNSTYLSQSIQVAQPSELNLMLYTTL